MARVLPESPPSAPAWPWRMAARLATAAAVVLVALVIAHWTWRILPLGAPNVSAEDVTTDVAFNPVMLAQLFGTHSEIQVAAAPVAATQDVGGARLIGVFAEANGRGYALLRFPDRVVLIEAGREIAPQVVLQSVGPTSVRILDRGEERELMLRETPAPPVPGPAAARTATAPPGRMASASSVCRPRAGFRGRVYRLNAELVSGLADKPERWRDLFQAVAGGLGVREGHAFAPMLGLQSGDRLLTANGIALRNAEDVRIAVLRPLVASEAVEVAGTRAGQAASWLLLNAGRCPA